MALMRFQFELMPKVQNSNPKLAAIARSGLIDCGWRFCEEWTMILFILPRLSPITIMSL